MRYVILPVTDAGSEVGALVVAARLSAVAFGPADLLRSMVLVVPLILLASGVLGWFLAGRAMRPVERLIDELEEVTDGRSLHRRLAVPNSGDELGAPRDDAERDVLPARTELRRAAALHGRRQPRTEDAAHGHARRRGARARPTRARPARCSRRSTPRWASSISSTELVDSLLTLARVDEGRAPLALEERDLRALVVDVGETAEMLGEQHGLTTRVTVPDHPVEVSVDPHRMHQLLLNLVTNAVKYTPAGGSVAVSLRKWRRECGSRCETPESASRRSTCRVLRPVLAGRPGPLAHRRPPRGRIGALHHQVDRRGPRRIDFGPQPAWAGVELRGVAAPDWGWRGGGRGVDRPASPRSGFGNFSFR